MSRHRSRPLSIPLALVAAAVFPAAAVAAPQSVTVTTPYTCTNEVSATVTTTVTAAAVETGAPLEVTTQSTIDADFRQFTRHFRGWHYTLSFDPPSAGVVGADAATVPLAAERTGGFLETGASTFRAAFPALTGPAGTVTAPAGATVAFTPRPFVISASGYGEDIVDGLLTLWYPSSSCTPATGAAPISLAVAGGATPEPTVYGYGLFGSATLKGGLSRGKVPVTGRLVVTPGEGGALTGTASIDPAPLKLTALGSLPITATATFKPSGAVTGTLIGDALKVTTPFAIRLSDVTMFGIKLTTSTACGTRGAVPISWTSGEGFSAVAGGGLTGTFALGTLTGCGAFNGLLSLLAQSPSSTVGVAVKRTLATG